MTTNIRPTAVPEQTPNPYSLRQLDEHGDVLSEKHVVAKSCSAAMRELKDVAVGADRIVVYNEEGNKAGEVNVDYWRLKRGRM